MSEHPILRSTSEIDFKKFRTLHISKTVDKIRLLKSNLRRLHNVLKESGIMHSGVVLTNEDNTTLLLAEPSNTHSVKMLCSSTDKFLEEEAHALLYSYYWSVQNFREAYASKDNTEEVRNEGRKALEDLIISMGFIIDDEGEIPKETPYLLVSITVGNALIAWCKNTHVDELLEDLLAACFDLCDVFGIKVDKENIEPEDLIDLAAANAYFYCPDKILSYLNADVINGNVSLDPYSIPEDVQTAGITLRNAATLIKQLTALHEGIDYLLNLLFSEEENIVPEQFNAKNHPVRNITVSSVLGSHLTETTEGKIIVTPDVPKTVRVVFVPKSHRYTR